MARQQVAVPVRRAGTGATRPGWRTLPRRALVWRMVHAAWSIAQLTALARIWAAVVTRRRGPAVWGSVLFIALEGGALLIGRGSCPVGPRQAAWGDPVPFFELLLPPRAAKAAVPILMAVSVVGIAGLLVWSQPALPVPNWRSPASPRPGMM